MSLSKWMEGTNSMFEFADEKPKIWSLWLTSFHKVKLWLPSQYSALGGILILNSELSSLPGVQARQRLRGGRKCPDAFCNQWVTAREEKSSPVLPLCHAVGFPGRAALPSPGSQSGRQNQALPGFTATESAFTSSQFEGLHEWCRSLPGHPLSFCSQSGWHFLKSFKNSLMISRPLWYILCAN